MRKDVLSLLLSASLVIGLMPVEGTGQSASAAENANQGISVVAEAETGGETEEGTFGDENQFNWSFEEATGTLAISGKGAMPDYPADRYTSVPWYEYASQIKKIVFTGDVTAIGEKTFLGYKALEEVDISGADSLTAIGNSTFSSNTALTTVTGMEQLETLGNSAFSATALQTVDMPKVTELPQNVFRNCKMTEVNLPGVLRITGVSAFSSCTELKKISLPGLTEVSGDNTFSNCTALEELDCPKLTTASGSNFAKDCTKLLTVNLPQLESIGANGFSGCISLLEVNLKKLKTMGDELFTNCFSLVYAELPVTVEALGSKTFANCSSLKRVYVRGTLASDVSANVFQSTSTILYNSPVVYVLSQEAAAKFSNYSSLDDEHADKVQVISEDVMDSYRAKEKVIVISQEDYDRAEPQDPVVIKNETGAEPVYYYYKQVTKNGVLRMELVDKTAPAQRPTELGDYYVRAITEATDTAWDTSSNYTGFTLYGDIVGEGWVYNSFRNSLTIEDASLITTDYESANAVPWHEYASVITNVKLAEEVTFTKVGAYVFSGMERMVDFELPEEVTQIGAYAFYYCHSWNDEINIAISRIGTYAFYGCNKITGTVSFSSRVTNIPDYSFYNCAGIQSITLPSRLSSMGSNVIAGCRSLTEIEIPSSLTVLPDGFLQDCIGITKIQIPDTVTRIGNYAFRSTGLASIEIPASITRIGRGAFAGITTLEKIIIPETVTQIDGDLFSGCVNLKYVEFERDDYTTLTLQKAGQPVQIYSETGTVTVTIDGMFSGCPDIVAICDGTTYETLSGYQNIYRAEEWPSEEAFDTYADKGWKGCVYKSDDFMTLYENTVAEANGLTESDYDAALWTAFQKTLADADILAKSGESTYEKVMNQRQAKKDIINGAKAFLRDTCDKTASLVVSDYDQDSESWWDYEDALDEAEAKYVSDTVDTIAEIVKADRALRAAMNNLDILPTDEAEAALDKVIGSANALNKADYSEDSWKALQDAIAEAEDVKAMGTISQIEAVQAKVQAALDALVKKPAASGTNPGKTPGTNSNTNPGTKPGTNPGKTQKVTVKKVSLKKVKSSKKKTLLVQWKKVSGVTGYQIQIATNKKMTKGKKTYKVTKAKTTKKTIKKLKRKKKYYVRICAYKKVNGKVYTGKWSAVKKVKVK